MTFIQEIQNRLNKENGLTRLVCGSIQQVYEICRYIYLNSDTIQCDFYTTLTGKLIVEVEDSTLTGDPNWF